MRVRGILVSTALVAGLASCGPGPASRGAAGSTECLAESIGALQLLPSVPKCASGKIACEVKCRLGEAAACLGLAYAAEDVASPEEVRGLYRQACLAGAANACTNFAASLWTGPMEDEELACVRRTFDWACAAGEQFACGMVARVVLESGGRADVAEWRRYLQDKCDHVGGFSCRVLAKHLEAGTFGAGEAESSPALLKRACDGGDVYACGTHRTAAETFK